MVARAAGSERLFFGASFRQTATYALVSFNSEGHLRPIRFYPF